MPAHASQASLLPASQVAGMSGVHHHVHVGPLTLLPWWSPSPGSIIFGFVFLIWLVFEQFTFFILLSVSQRASDPAYLRGSTSVNTMGDKENPSQWCTHLSHPSPALSTTTTLTKQLLRSKVAPSCNLLTEVTAAPLGCQCSPAYIFQPCLSSTCIPSALLTQLQCHHLPPAAQTCGSLLCLPACLHREPCCDNSPSLFLRLPLALCEFTHPIYPGIRAPDLEIQIQGTTKGKRDRLKIL